MLNADEEMGEVSASLFTAVGKLFLSMLDRYFLINLQCLGLAGFVKAKYPQQLPIWAGNKNYVCVKRDRNTVIFITHMWNNNKVVVRKLLTVAHNSPSQSTSGGLCAVWHEID